MGATGQVGLIADDDGYFRIAIGAILTRHFGFSEVIEATTLDEAVGALSRRDDIVIALFDPSMLGLKAPRDLRFVRECFPDIRVGVISASSCRSDIVQALEARVHGYMPKSLSVSELSGALQRVLSGGIYVPSCLSALPSADDETNTHLIEVDFSREVEATHVLTPRQQDVLNFIAQGKSNKEIALALKISEGTVKIHVAAIFRHLGVNSRAAAAVAGIQPISTRRRDLAFAK